MRYDPIYAGFATITQAMNYRSKHGGWIFESDVIDDYGRQYIWFDSSFTPSKIITHPVTKGMNGKLL